MSRWPRLGVILLAAALVVAGAARSEGPITDGPLNSAGGADVGVSAPPGVADWKVTFGDILLCATGPGADIELTGIRVGTGPGLRGVTVALRTVTTADLQTEGTDRFAVTPIGSEYGSPPEFAEPYAGGHRVAGTLAGRIAGTKVAQTCASRRAADAGFTEVLVTLEAGPAGGIVDGVWVDYRTDGQRATAYFHVRLVACGSAVTEPGFCGNPESE